MEARRPDIVFIGKKERELVMIDVAIPDDSTVKDKELEKLEKYQLLKDKIEKVWHIGKVIVVPCYIGALGAVSVNFKEYMKRIGVNVRLEVIKRKNSISGDSKDTKESTVPVRRRRRETWDPWLLVATRSQRL